MITRRRPQSSVNSAPMSSLMPPIFFDRRVRAHHAGERTFVGDGERRVAERLGLRDQFLGVRGAAQEAEVAEAVQLRVCRSRASLIRRSRAGTSVARRVHSR